MGPKSLVGQLGLLLYSDRKLELQIVTIGSLCLDRFVIRSATLLQPKVHASRRFLEDDTLQKYFLRHFAANSGAASMPFDV